MHEVDLTRWQHSHSHGSEIHSSHERRTRWVVALTFVMMVVEILAGIAFGSMALLADGWHMGTHAAAIGIAAFAYAYARKRAADPRFSFGTGKVGALGGFGSAVGLAVVAMMVLFESLARLAAPVEIHFDEAIAVAVIGLFVNLFCAWMLREDHHHAGEHHHHHRDHNLRGAYLHVLADAMTSCFAIAALTTGKYLGWTWMDPMMGIVGSLVITHWSIGLLRDTSGVLLDAEVSPERSVKIREAIEIGEKDRVVDLHVWRIGPRHLAAIVSVVSSRPRSPDHYKGLLADFPDLAHVTIEVHDSADDPVGRAPTSGSRDGQPRP